MIRKPIPLADVANPAAGAVLPAEFLNAYDIANVAELSWPVRIYKVRPANGAPPTHSDRGSAKNVMWRLRELNRSACSGYGFVLDVNPDTVAIPEAWQIPAQATIVDGFVVDFQRSLDALASQPSHQAIIKGLIRDGLKMHFKDNPSEVLGDLWQDFGLFCQMPDQHADTEFFFCRRFDPTAELLANGRWVLKVVVGTSTLDGRTFADYYRDGSVSDLADLLQRKRSNRLNRHNQPTDVRVWRDQCTAHQSHVTVLALADPESVIAHGTLGRHEQQAMAEGFVRCEAYKKGPVNVPLSELRLVLDSQITQEDHEETIIDPGERLRLCGDVGDFIDGAKIFGKTLRLGPAPVDLREFRTLLVGPPAIRLRDKERGYVRIEAPTTVSPESLKKRSRDRVERIRKHGFLQSRPINPLLAVPKQFSTHQEGRMKADLELIWRNQGIECTFETFVYQNANELGRHVEQHGYDSAIVVLPESSRRGFQRNDTHEQVKQCLTVPSQCIYHDNTVPPPWVNKPRQEFREKEERLARRISQRYELCLGNLLVKHHWVPFAPGEPFNYNVHVGLDVGGRHNTTAMACVGHGFASPQGDIVFRPEQIATDLQKAEPIHPEYLLRGLRTPFEILHSGLSDAGAPVDFNRALFFRDGPFSGDGDRWNETGALKQLHAEFLAKGWVRAELGLDGRGGPEIRGGLAIADERDRGRRESGCRPMRFPV